MRIIRFLGDDDRVHHGMERADGSATLLTDPQRVLGPASAGDRSLLFSKRRALVADDDEKMRELVATVLRSVGCTCTVCADGAEAVKVIEHEAIDLVVSDIVMPHHNGYEIFTAAKHRNGDIPIVLVTGFGYDPAHSLVRASQEGLTAVLYKPFSPQKLLDEVEQAIRRTTASPADALVPSDRVQGVQKLHAPLEPADVICIGQNYPGTSSRGHADHDHPPHVGHLSDETLEVFLKPTSSVQATGEAIRIPDCGSTDPQVDVEGELAVVIGATASNVTPEEAERYVLGYTAANDVTARRWQTHGGPPRWMRGKGFDTFCPLGPAIVTADELGDPAALAIRTEVNGTIVRHGSTAEMIRPVASIISTLSRYLVLRPGTVILMGAPPADDGVQTQSLQPGDEVVVEIEGIGRLVNHVEMAAATSLSAS